MKKNKLSCQFLSLLILMTGLFGCATPPPNDINNICNIFNQYPDWYFAAQKSQDRWKVPISVMMAIIHQESHFNSTAKPPREKLLGIIPWFRPTSAFGYSQALDDSWRRYKKEMHNYSANRDAFGYAIDFVGWYSNLASRKAGISKGDAYNLYLAYHDGIGGYTRGTYKNKVWLIQVAKKVERCAWSYHHQLQNCLNSLPKKKWWWF
jgi:hypothetical protein